MKDLGVYDEISIDGENERELSDALRTMRAKRPRDAEVRCRRVCK